MTLQTNQMVPVLMYHHVSPEPGGVTVSPVVFEEQMAYLAKAGYQALAAAEFQSFLAGQYKPAARSILITFDDGYLDNGVYAFPILERLGLRAVIFAVTGWIGDGATRLQPGNADQSHPPRVWSHRDCKAAIHAGNTDGIMLRSSDMEQMEASGVVEFHSHTHRHTRWDLDHRNAGERDALVEEDLRLSRDTLRSRLGKSSEHLAWPWGHAEPSYGTLAARVGFKVLYTTRRGVNSAGGSAQEVPRIATKNQGKHWLSSVLWIYRHSLPGRIYSWWENR